MQGGGGRLGTLIQAGTRRQDSLGTKCGPNSEIWGVAYIQGGLEEDSLTSDPGPRDGDPSTHAGLSPSLERAGLAQRSEVPKAGGGLWARDRAAGHAARPFCIPSGQGVQEGHPPPRPASDQQTLGGGPSGVEASESGFPPRSRSSLLLAPASLQATKPV